MSSITTAKLKGVSTTLGQVNIPAGQDFQIAGNVHCIGTGALQLPTGNTANRPGSPATGYTRWNTDTLKVEVYNGSAWQDL